MQHENIYIIGNGIIEAQEAGILAELEELYPDDDERRIVAQILLPQFRAKLIEVFARYGQENEIKQGQTPSFKQIPELCTMVDGMIDENKILLDLYGLFAPVMVKINEVREQVFKALNEQFKDEMKAAIAGHGISDRQSLLACGPRKFPSLDFGIFGKGKAFAAKVLGRPVEKNVGLPELENIADILGFEKTSIEDYKKALANHGIADRESLLACGPNKFRGLDFRPFGKGQAFAAKVLGRPVGKNVGLPELEEIADILGFEKSSIDDYKKALAGHGIIDRQSFLACGPKKFKGLDFGPFGKGQSFALKVLGSAVGVYASLAVLEAIADILFPQVESVDSQVP